VDSFYRTATRLYFERGSKEDGEGIPGCELCALRLCENPSGVMQVSRKGAKIPTRGRVVAKSVSISRRLVEFRVVNLDVVFDFSDFHDPGHH
jgi:hypothetical protein